MTTDSMKSHLCNICDQEFTNNSNLAKHRREVHILDDDDDQNRHYKSVHEEQEKVVLPSSSEKMKTTTSIKPLETAGFGSPEPETNSVDDYEDEIMNFEQDDIGADSAVSPEVNSESADDTKTKIFRKFNTSNKQSWQVNIAKSTVYNKISTNLICR